MYSPKIREDLVRKLYLLKHSKADKTPMTKTVNKAVEEFLVKQDKNKNGDLYANN